MSRAAALRPVRHSGNICPLVTPERPSSGRLRYMPRTFRINSPSVVAEIIDDEAIVLNLATGHYFSARGSACDLWHAIGSGHDADQTTASLATRYGISEPEIAPLVEEFISDLVLHNLVVETRIENGTAADFEPRFP